MHNVVVTIARVSCKLPEFIPRQTQCSIRHNPNLNWNTFVFPPHAQSLIPLLELLNEERQEEEFIHIEICKCVCEFWIYEMREMKKRATNKTYFLLTFNKFIIVYKIHKKIKIMFFMKYVCVMLAVFSVCELDEKRCIFAMCHHAN